MIKEENLTLNEDIKLFADDVLYKLWFSLNFGEKRSNT